MAPQYKLSYFNARAVAEPIRLLLAYVKVPYDDVRVEREDWPKLKETTPWGQMPVLEVDGVQIAQSKAIARYIAKKHGVAGDTELEQAKLDELIDVLDDIRTESVKWWRESDEAKKAELLKTIEGEVYPRYFNKFEALIKKNGNGVLVGKKITYGDINLANMVDQMTVHFKGVDMSKYPAIQEHCKKILSHPNIKDWIDRRPKTAF